MTCFTTEAVEALVVTHNSAKHIVPCLESLEANGALTTVVDTGSTDAIVERLKAGFPRVRVIQAGPNVGYGKALNLGFRQTTGAYVLLSNSDVVYRPGSIQRLREVLDHNPRVGLVGPQLVFPDGSWQWSYGDLPGIWSGLKDAIGITTFRHASRHWLWPRKIDRRPRDVPYASGAVLLARRAAYEELSGFDESFFPGGDECDLCARMQIAGWRTVFNPRAEVMHIRGGDFTHVPPAQHLASMVENQMRLAWKHLPAWKATLYFWLEQVQYQRLSATYTIVSALLPGAVPETIANKHASAHDLARIWRDRRDKALSNNLQSKFQRR